MLPVGVLMKEIIHFTILESFLAIMLITLAITILFRYMNLPVLLGYLLVGMVVGPHALAWIPSKEEIKALADFGVVLLMFTVGLEFSFSKLVLLRRSVFLVGVLQIIACILIAVIAGLFIK